MPGPTVVPWQNNGGSGRDPRRAGMAAGHVGAMGGTWVSRGHGAGRGGSRWVEGAAPAVGGDRSGLVVVPSLGIADLGRESGRG